MRSRTESKEFWTKQMMKELDVEEKLEQMIKRSVDAGYCEYNTVLDAAQAVLSAANYEKLTNYLDKKGM